MHNIISKALNKRARLVSVSSPGPKPWNVNSKPEVVNEGTDITIGLILDETHSLAQVEHGPLSDDTLKVADFKTLWGEKAELRRFKDGSITTSVVFECDGTLEQRGMLVARMTAFLLSKHFNATNEQGVVYWSGLGNRFLKPPGLDMFSNSFQPVVDAFISLTKQLKSLKALPLSVARVQPVSDALRYASVFIPQPVNKSKTVNIETQIDAIITFESSGRWPDDLVAVQNMKKAFYVRISEMLAEMYPGTENVVSTGFGTSIYDAGYIDIRHLSGYTFRCKIHHDREEFLCNQAVIAAKSDPRVQELRKLDQEAYLNTFHRQPFHAHHMSNLALRYAFFGTSLRLLKRWAGAHMLTTTESDGGVPESVLELLCASVYTAPAPFGAPSAGFTGFVRTLKMIASHDTQNEPIMVELEQGKLTSALRETIQANFDKLKSGGCGHIPIFIAHERDLNASWYGCTKLNPKLFNRMRTFAKGTLGHLTHRLETGVDHDLAPLFVTPTHGHFDAILNLDCSKLPQFLHSITFDPSVAPKRVSKFKNLPTPEDEILESLSMTDIGASYIADLKQRYGDVCHMFRDPYGGDKIAIKWKSNMLQPATEFKIGHGFNFRCEGEKVVPNCDAVLAEIQRMGEGICVSVTKL
jgi:U3 small nucleolar RNA-associated protein 22